MLLDTYNDTLDALIAKVRATQRETIITVGKTVASAVANGHCVHIFDSGHIINSELIFRGGGLILYKQFKYSLQVENPVRKRDRSAVNTDMTGLAAYALKASGALPGDVMFIGSVSGKTANVVDLAVEAKKFGLTTVAVTSVAYSEQVSSDHPCGKRLFECTDYVLDNCAPVGEAMMPVEGLEARLGAASGLSAAMIMWSVTAVVVEELLAMGVTPGVLKSSNFAGGPEFNASVLDTYAKYGW